MSAVVERSASLDLLAGRVRAAHEQVGANARGMLRAAVEAGEALLDRAVEFAHRRMTADPSWRPQPTIFDEGARR